MAGRKLRIRQFSIEDVEVGAADSAGEHLEEQVVRPDLRLREIPQHEGPADSIEKHRLHGLSFLAPPIDRGSGAPVAHARVSTADRRAASALAMAQS